jgi:hypothetical protein
MGREGTSMGTIQGDLHVVGIANLLQMLAADGRQGYLVLRSRSQRKVLKIEPNRLRLLSGARPGGRLGKLLLLGRKITQAGLEELREEERRTGVPLEKLAVRDGLLSTPVLEGLLRQQVAEEIYELFGWTRARFWFTEEEEGIVPPQEPPLCEVALDLDVVAIMLEAARRLDELSRIQSLIPDDRWVAERAPREVLLKDPGIDPGAVKEVLSWVDGRRSVGQIIERSAYSRFTVLSALYGLAVHSAIRLRLGEEAQAVPEPALRPS